MSFFSKKEIEIFETDRSLSLVIDWFSPLAYFLAFFSLMWCGFLAFWYTGVIGTGAPLIFLLFPIIHVLVGFGIVYYTICLFNNKTYIDVDENYLSIVHKPIPWWKGNNEFTTDSIEQLYVKEKITRSDNGSTVSYVVRMKMKDGTDKELFGLQNMESHQAIELEERLEQFIGIIDRPVKGEHAAGLKEQVEGPRRQRRNFSDSNLAYVYNTSLRDYVNLKDEQHQVSAISQYDWNDGDSDKVFQLLDKQGAAKSIYLEQNKALLSVFEESNIPIGKTGLSTLSEKAPPPNIQIDGETFYFAMTKKGFAFVTNKSRKTEMTQWLYQSTDRNQQIRFVNYEGQMTCYQGEKLSPTDFENTLDLNNPPQREEERLKNRNWDEEDFV